MISLSSDHSSAAVDGALAAERKYLVKGSPDRDVWLLLPPISFLVVF